MFLSNALNADVQAIIAEGRNGEFVSTDRAHRAYVLLMHARKWDRITATAVYWAWHGVLAKVEDDDIPF